MEDKRLECLMMSQIHRSDTPIVLALMKLLTDLPPLQHGDLTFYSTTVSVLNIDIFNTYSLDFRTIKIKPETFYWSLTSLVHSLANPSL